MNFSNLSEVVFNFVSANWERDDDASDEDLSVYYSNDDSEKAVKIYDNAWSGQDDLIEIWNDISREWVEIDEVCQVEAYFGLVVC